MNDGERSYKNDAFNRVTRVETTTGQVQINRYDAEGLRYEMEENKKLVQFIFNENREVVVEKSVDNLKRLIRSYDLWASEAEPEKTWYHYASDEQGSTIFITDNNKICNKYDYDAWGNLTTCEEILSNRFLYTGQQFDQITQQYYLRARFYNPVIARFTQEDVYRGDGLNLYIYCGNNPVIYYDPSGYKKRAAICEKNIYTRLKNTGHYTDERAYALSVAYTRARNANPNMTAAEAFKFATGKDTFGNRIIDPIKEYENINPKFFEKYPFNIPELAVEMPKVDRIYGSYKSATSQGYLREAQAYWMAVYNRCPKAFSEANLDKMFNPIRKVFDDYNFASPINDKTFRNSFPQYDIPGVRSSVLHHHHVGGRGQAIPVPGKMHIGSDNIHKLEKYYGIIYKRG